MKENGHLGFVCAAWLLTVPAVGADTIYRSVDAEGGVTYSLEPPAEAVVSEPVRIVPGPSTETVEEVAKRLEDARREAEASLEAVRERRRQQAEARKEAEERERLEREVAEQQRRIDALLQELAGPRVYVPPYPRRRPWPYPPYPTPSPPRSPKPVHSLPAPAPAPAPETSDSDRIRPPQRN